MTPLLLALLAFSLPAPGPDTPAREPQLAAHGTMAGMTYGAGGAIYFAASPDGGATFGPPVRVAEVPILPLNRHRGPRIAFSGPVIVISAVAGRTPAAGEHAHGLPADGDLLVWRSTDGGRTWAPPVTVNDVPGAPTEGLHALAADPKGNLFAAWLDKRGSGTMLYGAKSTDGGRTWSKNVRIYASADGTICQCCHPTVAFDASGAVLVMWRNVLGGDRDMYLVRSPDGAVFGEPGKLGKGSWKINACPMDGGGMALAGERLVTAWRREKTLYLSSPGGGETAIAEGMDIALAANSGGVLAVWTHAGSVQALPPGARKPVTLSPKGAFPAAVSLPGGGFLAAWESEGGIEVRQIAP